MSKLLRRIRELELLDLKVARIEAIVPRIKELSGKVNSLETVVDTLLDNTHYYSAAHIGFNGQIVRKKIFTDIISVLPFEVIVETGTWTGNTAGYMAEVSNLPVHSVEVSARFHRVAKLRLSNFDKVNLYYGDSRQFLRDLANSPLKTQLTFFYLDAHWYDDLPLNEELSIIATHWQRYVIMVDDFQVPGDAGYGFDKAIKAMNISLIQPQVDEHQLKIFFPSTPSTQEDGGKRGTVILTQDNDMADRLSPLSSLRRYTPSGS